MVPQDHRPCADAQAPALGHGVPCVEAQVHDHLFELSWIAEDVEARSQVRVKGDRLVEGPPLEPKDCPNDVRDRHGDRLPRISACKGQQLTREAGAAAGGLVDVGEHLGQLEVGDAAGGRALEVGHVA